MAKLSLACIVCSSERPLFQGPVCHVSLPGAEGAMTVFPGHTPLLTTLAPGRLCLRTSEHDTSQVFLILKGFAHITPKAVQIFAPHIWNCADMTLQELRDKLKNIAVTSKVQSMIEHAFQNHSCTERTYA